MNDKKTPQNKAILLAYFDGECLFCNKMVLMAIKYADPGLIKFAKIGAPSFQQLDLSSDINSLVVLFDKKIFTGWQACKTLGLQLGHSPLWLKIICRYTPHWLGEICYRWVAKNRKKIFASPKSCSIDFATHKDFFLDENETLDRGEKRH